MSESRQSDPAPAGGRVRRRPVLRVAVGLALLAAAVLAGARWHEPLGRLLGWSAPAGAGRPPGASPAPQLWTCSMHPQVIRDQPGDCPICHMKLEPVQAAASGAGLVRIDPVVVQNMGVRTAEVVTGPLHRTFRVVGFLEEPEPNHLDISTRVSGWIETLHANVDGMEVRKGDPLFELYSPELTVAIEELIATRAAGGTAPHDAAPHAGAPHAQGSGSLGHLHDAIVGKLLALGLDEGEIERLGALEHAPRTVTIRSPWNGHVTEKNVVEGAAVQAGQRILRLADRSTMWLDLEVHEQQLPFFQPGRAVRATLDAVPGTVFEGPIAFIHPHLNETTRTAMVRAVLDNPTHVLRQGMYAVANVDALLADGAVLVPREAVIDTGTRQLAFVVLEAGLFEPRAVRMGLPGDDGVVQVLEGLQPGERVVTSGQFLLDSESRLREALAKALHDGLLVPPEAAAGTAPAAPAPHDHGGHR